MAGPLRRLARPGSFHPDVLRSELAASAATISLRNRQTRIPLTLANRHVQTKKVDLTQGSEGFTWLQREIMAATGEVDVPKIGELFAIEPDHWELRGDKVLWDRLAAELADTPLPEDTRQMGRLLENAFWDATGYSLSLSNQVIVDGFAVEGQTRGGVSGADWRYRLFPLIIRRFEAETGAAAA